VQHNREQRIFFATLWAFLVCSLVYFTVRLSSGRLFLPLTIWYLFLFLDAGFIVFLFLPHAGRAVPGVPGRYEETLRGRRWYPATLPEIVDGRGDPPPPANGVLPPPRAIPFVPLVPLLLLLGCIALAYPDIPDETGWRGRETARLEGIYARSRAGIVSMETRAIDLAERTAAGLDWEGARGDSTELRAAAIAAVDSVARAARLSDEPLPGGGIQALLADGTLIAWGGSPRYFETARPDVPDSVRVFTARTPLYTLLVAEARSPGGEGRVVVDVPLEVNYRINNRFLRSTSLGELLSRRLGEDVEFNFSMGEHRGFIPWRDRSLAIDEVQVVSAPNAGVQIVGVVRSTTGLPLARLRVNGDPFAAAMRERETRRSLWARLALSLAVVVIAVWTYAVYCKRAAREEKRGAVLARRIAVLAVFVVLIRFVLLHLKVPGAFFRTAVFNPAYFADAFPGGFLMNAGEFLVTAAFVLFFVFGAIKSYRTYYPGRLERPLGGARAARAHRLAAKAALVFAALALSLWLSSETIMRGVVNSSPRLVGLDVKLADATVMTLHLSFLFAVSAYFIAALFLVRLALAWGGGGLGEGLAASAAAVAGVAALVAAGVLAPGGWLLVAVAAGLVALALRIFPLLRKEEAVSVVFASFFLVLAATTVVYAVADDVYDKLRRSRAIEKARSFNHPEDNVVQVQLPDVCEEISGSPTSAPRILAREESAAFEIWAESFLSRLGLSCACEVFDAAGERISRFAVGMPIDPPRRPPERERLRQGGFVEEQRMETKEGAVYYYKGYAPVSNARENLVGWVEITIPYFFENPELLARTGQMTPEILQNIERGLPAPRKDEPENLLVARVSGGRVAASSRSELRAGTTVPTDADEWFVVRAGSDTYNGVVSLREDGEGYLVGYREPGAVERLLQWAAVVSIDIVLTLASLLALFVLRRLPVLRGIMPDVSPAGGLGFRQKVLLSFLVVSMLPVVILGAFSSGVLQRRYRAEMENEALSRARAAASLLNHSIRSEGVSFSVNTFTGGPIAGDFSEALTPEELAQVMSSSNVGQVVVSYEAPHLYGGVMVPAGGPAAPVGDLYYRRRLDDEFMRSVAAALGTDVNIYYGPFIGASSERELFVGGLIDAVVPPSVYVDVALGRGATAVRRQALGDYSYYVASAPLPAVGAMGNAVLSAPMLYRPALAQGEMTTLVLGLLALLFAAATTLGMFLAGKIFDPIAALQGGTRRIIDGDLEFRLESKAPDEIGELVASFNTMTAALRDARRGLLERQRYLAAVLDNVATGVMAIDRDGRITTLNPPGERILRLEGAAVTGRKPEEVLGEGLESLRSFVASSGAEIVEAELSLFSGESARTVKAVVASLVEGGERLGTVVVFDDLTELIKTKKLAAWLEMARQIAHEVKNPLTPIKLSAQLMRRAFDSGSEEFPEIFRSGVDTVIQQTEILRRIAGEFSSFGKATRLVREAVPLREFLEEIVSYYRGVERIAITLDAGGNPRAYADREALRKILVNLVENSIEAMDGKGTIAISATRDGGSARVSVVDSGAGLSPEMQARLFEPYFSTKTNGVGLGLAISQSLARAMDGEVRLRNRDGASGVEAVVLLPLAKES
jgi:PAS domain S-box-containing protein